MDALHQGSPNLQTGYNRTQKIDVLPSLLKYIENNSLKSRRTVVLTDNKYIIIIEVLYLFGQFATE